MGDFHFLLRHALTGGVLLLFIFNGLYIFRPSLGEGTLAWLISLENLESLSKLLPVLVSAPILGIAIQGLHVTVLHWRKLAFTDPARLQIAERVQDVMLSGSTWGLPHDAARSYAQALRGIPPDAAFVWLYHTCAQPHLIEWARRRRSYAYLGWNWAAAAILGVLLGTSVPWFVQLQPGQSSVLHGDHIRLALIVFSTLWIWGTCHLARIMKRDVDAMELVWSYTQLYPHVKERVAKELVVAIQLPVSQAAAPPIGRSQDAGDLWTRPNGGGV